MTPPPAADGRPGRRGSIPRRSWPRPWAGWPRVTTLAALDEAAERPARASARRWPGRIRASSASSPASVPRPDGGCNEARRQIESHLAEQRREPRARRAAGAAAGATGWT